ACCGQNATIKLFKASSGQCIQTIYGHFDYIFTLLHLEDYMEKEIDQVIEEMVNEFENSVDNIDVDDQIAINDVIVSGGNDCIIRVWKINSGTCVKELSGHENTIRK